LKHIFTLYFILWLPNITLSQNDSVKKWQFSGYGEFYFSKNLENNYPKEKPSFLYNHKRNNELNANLLIAKANYLDTNTRANFGVMFGNYAQYNLSSEPTWAQFVYEANIGFKISKKHTIWAEVGVFPSHIGFESAIGADCFTLSRSIVAENSPYYEAGAKITYNNKKNTWLFSAMYLNGWQKIQKPDSLNKPSFGTQIQYKPNDKLLINYSTFLGTDKPDNYNAFRQYHNLYCIYNPNNKWGFITGIDIGKDKYNNRNYNTWLAPVGIVKYAVNEKVKIASRVEYFLDEKQIITVTNTPNGFQTFGASINVDYQINHMMVFRIESKYYQSKDIVFINKNYFTDFTAALVIKL
jgi:Putative beta-barrel porin-2, OmpL-like. bbp2